MPLPAIDDFSDAALEKPLGVPTPEEITANLAPLTAQETARTLQPRQTFERVAPEQSEEQRFLSENVRPGVPLYTRAAQAPGGAPVDQIDAPGMGYAPSIEMGMTSPIFRYQMARRTGLQSQLKYAKTKLGEENARISKDGKEIIVTVPNPDEPGKSMDVTVNDRDMTLGDFTALAAYVPEFAGAVLGLAAARAGRPPDAKGLLNMLKDMFGGAVGQETAGGLAEAGTRWQDKEVVNPGEITRKRSLQLPVDMGMDVLGVGIGKTAIGTSRFLQAPFSSARTSVQSEGLEAAARLKTETGISPTYTPGQASGSTLLVTGERYTKSTLAGSSRMERMFEQQESDKKALFDAISSGGGTDEEVGQQLIARLQASRNATEGALQTSKSALEESAGTRIAASLKKSSPTAPELTPVQGGDKLRSEIVNERSGPGMVMEQKAKLYADRDAIPGAKDAIIPTSKTLASLKNIELPMRSVTKEVKGFDAYGSPTSKAATTKEPVFEFLDPDVEQFLSTKLDPKMPLNQMIYMRSRLNEHIARGEAIKGITTKELSDISHAMSKDIEVGIDAFPVGELKTAHLAAQKFYKERVLPFEEAGISDVFKGPMDPGFIESEQIIARIVGSPGKYNRTMKLLGTSSPGAKTIRAFVREDLLRRSAYDYDPARLEASRFISNLRRLREDTPDIYNDVIGQRGDALLENATLMGTAQGSISLKDAQQALTGKQSAFHLQEMIRNQKDVDKLEVDQLIKAYTVGKLDVNTIQPEKMVRTFLTTGTDKQIVKLMDGIRADNPALAKQVERKMTENILADAGGSKVTDISIREILDDPKMSAKYAAVLGGHQMSLLRDTAAYLGPIDYASQVARGAAVFVKASQMGRFFKAITDMTAPTKELGEFVKFKLASLVITSPVMRSWALNTPFQFHGDLVKAMVLSEPFIKALAEDVADDGKLASIVSSIRQMLTFGEDTTAPENTNLIPADQF